MRPYLLYAMRKEVFARKYELRDFLEPLIILPYGFWGIYLFDNGFDWLVIVLGAILFLIIPAVITVMWEKL